MLNDHAELKNAEPLFSAKDIALALFNQSRDFFIAMRMKQDGTLITNAETPNTSLPKAYMTDLILHVENEIFAESDLIARALKMAHWMKVCILCYEAGDMLSAHAIKMALSSQAFSYLKITRELADAELRSQKLLDRFNDFTKLRPTDMNDTTHLVVPAIDTLEREYSSMLSQIDLDENGPMRVLANERNDLKEIKVFLDRIETNRQLIKDYNDKYVFPLIEKAIAHQPKPSPADGYIRSLKLSEKALREKNLLKTNSLRERKIKKHFLTNTKNLE